MTRILQRVCLTLFLGLLSLTLLAQEKTQAYYNSHENEIIQDAQSSFNKGDYERAVELCKWHYIIIGNHFADSLREKAERCASLKKEMESLRDAGKLDEARKVAKSLLSINPKDALAQEVYDISMPTPEPASVEKDTASLANVVREMLYDSLVDTVSITTMAEPELVLPVEEGNINEGSVLGEQPVEIAEQVPVKSKSSNNTATLGKNSPLRNRFVVKAGAMSGFIVLANEVLAYQGSLGIYDIGGSRCGVDVGAIYVAEVDPFVILTSSVVFRASKRFYPKIELGFLMENGVDEMLAGPGLTCMIGKHFCVELSTFMLGFEEGDLVVGILPGLSIGLAF